MTRAVVNVATGARYQRGQARLLQALAKYGTATAVAMHWGSIALVWPPHAERPYAFKAYALMSASISHDLLLWCDSSILPLRSLEPLWERIERDGYWFSDNGYSNYTWTANSA